MQSNIARGKTLPPLAHQCVHAQMRSSIISKRQDLYHHWSTNACIIIEVHSHPLLLKRHCFWTTINDCQTLSYHVKSHTMPVSIGTPELSMLLCCPMHVGILLDTLHVKLFASLCERIFWSGHVNAAMHPQVLLWQKPADGAAACVFVCLCTCACTCLLDFTLAVKIA